MIKTTIDVDEKYDNTTAKSKEEKKKKISVLELKDYLKTKKQVRHSITKNHSSGTSYKRDSKPYSVKCSLINLSVENLNLDQSDLSNEKDPLKKICTGSNIPVRSLKMDDAISSEVLGEFETLVFPEILKEATYSLDVLARTLFEKEKDEAEKSPRRIEVVKKGCCSTQERSMYFGQDAGYVPIVPTVREKLLQNRDMVTKVLSKVTCELETEGSYDHLRVEVNAIIDSREKKCSLNVNLKIWQDLAEKMRESYEQFEKDFKARKKHYLEEIERVSQEIDASYCENIEKLDYVKRCEESKLEQQNLKQKFEETALLNEIEELQKLMKIEKRVNKELIDYFDYAINHSEAEILSWTTRYNEEMEKRQQDMINLEGKIEQLEEYIMSLRQTKATRQLVIDDYLAEEKKIKDEENYWITVHRCATMIQALWRGYAVRHRVGHYKTLFEDKKRSSSTKSQKQKSKKKGKKK